MSTRENIRLIARASCHDRLMIHARYSQLDLSEDRCNTNKKTTISAAYFAHFKMHV